MWPRRRCVARSLRGGRRWPPNRRDAEQRARRRAPRLAFGATRQGLQRVGHKLGQVFEDQAFIVEQHGAVAGHCNDDLTEADSAALEHELRVCSVIGYFIATDEPAAIPEGELESRNAERLT